MRVCVYVCVCICVYVYVPWMSTKKVYPGGMYVYVYVCVYVCMYVYVYVYMYMYVLELGQSVIEAVDVDKESIP
jgi:hypothetical protein